MNRGYLARLALLFLPALVHCTSLGSAKVERFSPFIHQGPCDPRNGPCAARSLRAELTWDTPGTDLDLHCVMGGSGSEYEKFWFSIGDSFYQDPEPGPVFGGNRHHLGDVEEAGPVESMVAEPIEVSRPYVFGVHFHTRYLQSAPKSKATLRLFCEGREVARYARTLSASGLGELEHDFWTAAEVVMDPRFGCEVRDIDSLVATRQVHQSVPREP